MPKDQRVELFISLAASIELESDRLMQQTGNTSPLTPEQRKTAATKGIPRRRQAPLQRGKREDKGRKGSGL
jgi:hypothetical protein